MALKVAPRWKGSLLVSALLLLVGWSATASAATEPRTGVSFPDAYKKTPLSKLGVRTKGPIKVYAVGQYGEKYYMLKLVMGVSAEKMSSALADALKPRCESLGCTLDEIDQFESILLQGLPDGASKGTTLVFGTGGGKLTINVEDESIGKVSSKALATAFDGIYTDKNAVCKLKAVEQTEEGGGGFFSFINKDNKGTYLAVAVILGTNLLLLVYSKRTTAKVYELNVYPIKSCAEQPMTTAKVTARGFEGDRILQVTDKNGKYCTPRDEDKTLLFKVQPRLHHDGLLVLNAPNMASLEMNLSKTKTTNRKVELNEVPNKKFVLQDYGNTVASWMQKATGIPSCRVTGYGDSFDRKVQMNPAQGDAVPTDSNNGGPPLVSLADEAPFLLTSTSSLTDLNLRLQRRGKAMVDMRRFRPNLVIEGLSPWEEDTWKRIRIGNSVFHVWQRCGRCAMTTIDRDSLKRSGEPLATLNTFRERANGMRNFGMHLVPIVNTSSDSSYEISVGDKVDVLEYDEERVKEWKRLFG